MPSFLGDLGIPDYFGFSGPVYSWLHQITRHPFYAWKLLIMRIYYSRLLDVVSLFWIFLITEHIRKFDYAWKFPIFSCGGSWRSSHFPPVRVLPLCKSAVHITLRAGRTQVWRRSARTFAIWPRRRRHGCMSRFARSTTLKFCGFYTGLSQRKFNGMLWRLCRRPTW